MLQDIKWRLLFEEVVRINFKSFSSSIKEPTEGEAANIPESFYDEAVEKDKLYFDAVTVLKSGGLDKIAFAKVSKSWKEVEDPKALTRSFTSPVRAVADADDDDTIFEEEDEEDGSDEVGAPQYTARDVRSHEGVAEEFVESNKDLADHVLSFEDMNTIPLTSLDYTQPHEYQSEMSDPRNEPFIKDSDPDKYRFD